MTNEDEHLKKAVRSIRSDGLSQRAKPTDKALVDTHGESRQRWIGVDLDGTLAEYHGWVGIEHIGSPIPRMVERVDKWLREGKKVKIVTARVAPGSDDLQTRRSYIEIWLFHTFGTLARRIEITHEKDPGMIELWDDRCVQVIPNTGKRIDGKDE